MPAGACECTAAGQVVSICVSACAHFGSKRVNIKESFKNHYCGYYVNLDLTVFKEAKRFSSTCGEKMLLFFLVKFLFSTIANIHLECCI